jgi:hypothetical protein
VAGTWRRRGIRGSAYTIWPIRKDLVVMSQWTHHLLMTQTEWWVPERLYCICGRTAYTWLPQFWTLTCVLGTKLPSFFLLSLP